MFSVFLVGIVLGSFFGRVHFLAWLKINEHTLALRMCLPHCNGRNISFDRFWLSSDLPVSLIICVPSEYQCSLVGPLATLRISRLCNFDIRGIVTVQDCYLI